MRAWWRGGRTSAPETEQPQPTQPSPQPRYPRRRPRDPEEPFRTAVITFVRNESVYLPKWVDHYGSAFGVENLYVVDDNSDDGSTDHLPCDVVRIPPVRNGKFETTRMAFLAGQSRALLSLYDAVVFTDADEFLVADPARHTSLASFIESRPDDALAVGALGFNVVHGPGEPPLDLSRPFLSQRRLAAFVPVMCKPSVKFVPAPWYHASHGIRLPYRVHPDLFMFHFKFADRDLLTAAAAHRRSMVEADGRSTGTSWRRGPDELVSLLEEITAGVDADAVAEFVPPEGPEREALSVPDDGGRWRAPRGSQLELMRTRPLVRIPERFRGSV